MSEAQAIVNKLLLEGDVDDPQRYIDWLSRKEELGGLEKVSFGISIHTSNQDMIELNAREDGIPTDQAFWDKINADVERIERSALDVLRDTGIHVVDEGHGEYGDLMLNAWLDSDVPDEDRRNLKMILDAMDSEMPTTSSGTMDSFLPGATEKLFHGVSDVGHLIDVTIEFFAQDLKEWAEVNLTESAQRLVEPAILHKRTTTVTTGATHSDAMERLLQQGFFGKVRSLDDLHALGETDLPAFNAIWDQVEIGFLTRRGEFVTRDDASRITGIRDVHGEDLPESVDPDDPEAFVSGYRNKWYELFYLDSRWRGDPQHGGVFVGTYETIEAALTMAKKRKLVTRWRHAWIEEQGEGEPGPDTPENAILGSEPTGAVYDITPDYQAVLRQAKIKEDAADDDSPDHYLTGSLSFDDLKQRIQNYGLAIQMTDIWGRWVVFGGFAYWATKGTPLKSVPHEEVADEPLMPDFFREQLEKFMRDEKITSYRIQISGGYPQHTYFKLAIPKIQFDAASWQGYAEPLASNPDYVADIDAENREWLPEAIEPFRQPDEITCGPSVIHMLNQSLGKANVSFEEITKLTRTNRIWGSLPLFMTSALRKLGLPFEKRKITASAQLAKELEGAVCAVLSVYADGIPHWILVTGTEGTQFSVNDPAEGAVVYDQARMQAALDPSTLSGVYKTVGFMIGTTYRIKCSVQEAKEGADPDDPAEFVDQYVTALDPNKVLPELGFSERRPSWNCSDPHYKWWEAWKHEHKWTVIRKSEAEPDVMEVSISRPRNIQGHPLHDYEEVGGFYCLIGELKSRLENAGFMRPEGYFNPGYTTESTDDEIDPANYVDSTLNADAALRELGFSFKGTSQDTGRDHWLKNIGRGLWHSVIVDKASPTVNYRQVRVKGRGVLDKEFQVLLHMDVPISDVRRLMMKWATPSEVKASHEVNEADEEGLDVTQYVDTTFDISALLKRLGYTEEHRENNPKLKGWYKLFHRQPPLIRNDYMIYVDRRGAGMEPHEGDIIYDSVIYVARDKRWVPFLYNWGKRVGELKPTLERLEDAIKNDNLDDPTLKESMEQAELPLDKPTPDVAVPGPDDPETVLQAHEHGQIGTTLKALKFRKTKTRGTTYRIHGEPVAPHFWFKVMEAHGQKHAFYVFFHQNGFHVDVWDRENNKWHEGHPRLDVHPRTSGHAAQILHDLYAVLIESTKANLPLDQERELLHRRIQHHNQWYEDLVKGLRADADRLANHMAQQGGQIPGHLGPGQPA